VHIEPKAAMVGGGLWMPPRPALVKIRAAIVERQKEFEATLKGSFKTRFGALSEEAMLVRLPRGFDADAPAAKWLRFQSFTAGRAIPDADLASPKLPKLIAKDFAAMRPFVRFLNGALGYPPDEHRVA
jgi:uncharacterized protein (TIGR02453 family)